MFEHKKAFSVMNFKCQTCGALELIWNSKDGLPSFTIPSVCCGAPMHHFFEGLDHVREDINEVVKIGVKRVFTYPTRKQFKKHCEKYVAENWAVFSKDFTQARQAVDFFESQYEEGRPIISEIETVEGVDLELLEKMKDFKITLPGSKK